MSDKRRPREARTRGAGVLSQNPDRFRSVVRKRSLRADYLDSFRRRVVQDALAEATAVYWRRRADTFAAAMPRPEDFRGKATDAALRARTERLVATARACRQRAAVALLSRSEVE